MYSSQLYFSVPNELRLNSTYYLKIKIHNKRELQSIVINHSADIDYKDIMIIYKKCTRESFFFNINTTLPANNPLCFRKNLLGSIYK